MKKRIISIACVLAFLALMVLYVYSQNNPILVSQESSTPSVNMVPIKVPTGWTTGYNTTGNRERIDMFMDTEGEMRVALGTIELANEAVFSDLTEDNVKAICDQVISAEDQPLNDPVVSKIDNAYHVEYQFNIENDLLYITFHAPLNDGLLYEILEVKPNAETQRIRTEVLNAIGKR